MQNEHNEISSLHKHFMLTLGQGLRAVHEKNILVASWLPSNFLRSQLATECFFLVASKWFWEPTGSKELFFGFQHLFFRSQEAETFLVAMSHVF